MKENPRSSRSSSNPSHLLVGRVGRAVGLKGEVEVLVSSDAPDRFAAGGTVYVDDGGSKVLTVEASRSRGDRTVVKFAEIDERTAAESLRGAELVIPLAQARELETGEYWDHDLIGCAVVTVQGERVGQVTDVLQQPSGSLLVVKNAGGEHLVPLIQEVIRSVEPGVLITIEPIPGLLGD